MRRAIALGFAIAAIVASLALVAQGLTCGVRSVEAGCTTPEECAARATCESHLHPLAVPLVLLAILGAAGAWWALPGVPLGAGVLAAGVGALFGLSLGVWGVGIAALLLISGILAPGRLDWEARERTLRWTAPVAGLVPLVAMGAVIMGRLDPAAAWAGALGPVAAWFVLLAWVVARPSR